jgi:hypothetical protein
MCGGTTSSNTLIYTNPNQLKNDLNSNIEEVGSTSINCGYYPQPNYFNHYEFHCGTSSYVQVNGFPLQKALDIAESDITYAEFGEVAEWMDENELYRQMTEDENNSINNAVLQQFYNEQHNDPTRYIVETDLLLANLSGELINSNMTFAEYQSALDNAEQLNNQIVSTEVYEQNEQIMNELYIKYC